MSLRITRVKGKMHFPPDVDPADVDWEPLPESELKTPGNSATTHCARADHNPMARTRCSPLAE
jgi:hypothetical protein